MKKPVSSNDFDWEMFQQQAYMQQQVAQQNLQAYLSSLNYTPNKQGKDQQTVNPRFNRNQDNMLPHEQPQRPYNHPHDIIQTDHNAILNNNVSISHISRSPTPNISNLRTPNSAQYTNNITNPESDDQRRSQVSTNSSVSSVNPAAGTSINGVLFNNGTHDMINNISNWTNDSIINGVPIQAGEDSNKAHVHNSPNPVYPHDPNTTTYQTQFLPPYTEQHVLNLPVGADSNYHQHIMNKNMAGQPMNVAMTNPVAGVPVHQTHHNQSNRVDNVGNTDPAFSTINNNTIPRVPNQFSEYENSARSAQAEEFWTVNDDYGFLT